MQFEPAPLNEKKEIAMDIPNAIANLPRSTINTLYLSSIVTAMDKNIRINDLLEEIQKLKDDIFKMAKESVGITD